MPARGGGGRNAHRASSSARETRNSSWRHPRGGIQKRRGVVTARDPDGDLDMDGGSSGGRGDSRRGGPRGSLSARALGQGRALDVINMALSDDGLLSTRFANGAHRRSTLIRNARSIPSLVWLRVHGLQESKAARNEGGGLHEILAFIERKATAINSNNHPVTVKKSLIDGDFVYIAATAQDAERILNINGFDFAGAKLRIDKSPNPANATLQGQPSSGALETRAKLQAVLDQRYEQTDKSLRLNNLSQDPQLFTLGMFETKERAEKTFKVIMLICDGFFKSAQQKREAIESITIAENGIENVSQVASLATTFPGLKKLELSHNLLSSMTSLQAWKGRLRDLETIHVAGNPMVINDPSYKEQLMQWYPRLQYIDGVQVRTAEQAAAAAAASRPQPIPQRGPDFRDVSEIGKKFLFEVFAGFDNDRPGLLDKYYDETSLFSLAVDTDSVRGPDAPPTLSWKPYLKYSRNMLKITNPPTRVHRLFKGAAAIGYLWEILPLTKHPNLELELAKYIMDCHMIPGLVDPTGQSVKGVDGLIISVHGEFEDLGQMGKRSFSRTFILGPGLPERHLIRVVSDMLALRAANPLPNLHSTPVAQTLEQQEQAHKQSLIADLSKQTGMTAAYSEMCLVGVDWDVAKGVVIFHEKRAQLPPDAFMVPS